MRTFAAMAVLAVAGLVAGTAAGDPVPLPPLPTVTVPPLPLPTVPQLPPAPAPVPTITTVTAPTPSLPQVPGSVPRVPSAVGLPGSSGGTGSSGETSGTGATGASGSAGSARVSHFRSSRPWIGTTGPKRRRTTTLVFVLPSAATVIFTVNQVSPDCRGIGHFSVAGHAGLNRVRFGGRVHGRPLAPGTYHISARTAAGRLVRRITLVVVAGSAPTPSELRSLRAANTCSATTRDVAATGDLASADATPSTQGEPPSSAPQRSASGLPTEPKDPSGVLGSTMQKTARAIRPVLVALLALAIVMLALASLPGFAVPEPRVNEVLARHRLEIAGLGAAALVAVALAFLLA